MTDTEISNLHPRSDRRAISPSKGSQILHPVR